MNKLSWWVVQWYHEGDFPTHGRFVDVLVAAPDEATAVQVAAENEGEVLPMAHARPVEIPDLKGRTRPFVMIG